MEQHVYSIWLAKGIGGLAEILRRFAECKPVLGEGERQAFAEAATKLHDAFRLLLDNYSDADEPTTDEPVPADCHGDGAGAAVGVVPLD